MYALITYEDGTELEVDDFAGWAAEIIGNPSASEDDLVALANYVLDIAEEIVSVNIDGDIITFTNDEHYRDGWDSVSTEEV
ncbi:MAG TPA: hypothetical protein VLA34_12185 [Candidatus Krumholzibacterium sp.]|nr:hypothetical protein [Candidatus Krumholzibacterium sp.]